MIHLCETSQRRLKFAAEIPFGRYQAAADK